jgi:hypothetical protein
MKYAICDFRTAVEPGREDDLALDIRRQGEGAGHIA